MSYVVFFGFVAAVGVGGYFVYRDFQKGGQKVNAADPTATPVEDIQPELRSPFPSVVLKKPMEDSLPTVLGTLSSGLIEPPGTFRHAATVVQSNALEPSTMQPAWQIAARICTEITQTYQQRNQMVKNLQVARPTATPDTPGRSAVDVRFAKEKDEFFKRSAESRWKNTAATQRKRIEGLYEQLIAAEEKAKQH